MKPGVEEVQKVIEDLKEQVSVLKIVRDAANRTEGARLLSITITQMEQAIFTLMQVGAESYPL